MERTEIQNNIVSVLNDMTQDWELELENGINAETGLMSDLAFESIDVVQLAVSLEQRFAKKGLPFEKLFMSMKWLILSREIWPETILK
jgi:acyl carrier protein